MKVFGNESFVNTVGHMAHKYIESKLWSMQDRTQITVADINGAIRFVCLSEIMYMESDRKYTRLYMVNDDVITAKTSISDISKEVPDRFVSVHRCFIVNTDYVSQIKTNKVIMTDKNEITIPARRFAQIKQTIIEKKN